MAAEWESHYATWLGWPHNASDWPGKFAPIPWVYGEIVRALASGEIVRILVNSAQHERQAQHVLERVGVDLARVEFFRFPTDRGWTRDFGPLFVRRTRPRPELGIARFRFNAWAKYPDWKRDDRIPERVATRLKVRLFRARAGAGDVVLEGGSIDVNGRGTLLTTEECLLDPAVQVRNPGLGRGEIEAVLRDRLGVTNVLWLAKGIAGDDTHGHVDDLCRFVNPRTVVLCRETDPHDANYGPLEENRERPVVRIVRVRLPAQCELQAARGYDSKTGPRSTWKICRCRRRSTSRANASPRVMRTSTSRTGPSWCRRLTIPRTASRLASSRS